MFVRHIPSCMLPQTILLGLFVLPQTKSCWVCLYGTYQVACCHRRSCWVCLYSHRVSPVCTATYTVSYCHRPSPAGYVCTAHTKLHTATDDPVGPVCTQTKSCLHCHIHTHTATGCHIHSLILPQTKSCWVCSHCHIHSLILPQTKSCWVCLYCTYQVAYCHRRSCWVCLYSHRLSPVCTATYTVSYCHRLSPAGSVCTATYSLRLLFVLPHSKSRAARDGSVGSAHVATQQAHGPYAWSANSPHIALSSKCFWLTSYINPFPAPPPPREPVWPSGKALGW